MGIFEMSHATKKKLHLNPGLKEEPKLMKKGYYEIYSYDEHPGTGNPKSTKKVLGVIAKDAADARNQARKRYPDEEIDVGRHHTVEE